MNIKVGVYVESDDEDESGSRRVLLDKLTLIT